MKLFVNKGNYDYGALYFDINFKEYCRLDGYGARNPDEDTLITVKLSDTDRRFGGEFWRDKRYRIFYTEKYSLEDSYDYNLVELNDSVINIVEEFYNLSMDTIFKIFDEMEWLKRYREENRL